MKDLKIEYVDGKLIALDIDGRSLLNKAVQGIQFTHEHGSSPTFKVTLVEEVINPHVTSTADAAGVKKTATHNSMHSHQQRRK